MSARAVGRAYDARAEEYVALFGDVERLAPADRELVSRWCTSTRGRLLDAGCGPGQWTRFLRDHARSAVGLDLAQRFLAAARTADPTVPLVRGSLGALPVRTGSVGGVLAWYSTIHTRPEALPATFAELGRVLAPGGSLLLGFVDGAPGEPFAHAVVTAYSWSVDALADLLDAAGFVVVEHHQRHDEGRRPHGALIAARAGTVRLHRGTG